MAQIHNDKTREYFLDLQDILRDTEANLAVAKLLGSKTGNLTSRIKTLKDDTYIIYGKVQLFSDDDIIKEINNCIEVYSKIKDIWANNGKNSFHSVRITGFSDVVAVDLSDGFPKIPANVVPDIDYTVEAGLSLAWNSLIGTVDEIMLQWITYKKSLSSVMPTEMVTANGKMKAIPKVKISIGKLSPEGSDALYKLCIDYKVFKYLPRETFASGLNEKGAKVLTINTKTAFNNLHRNSYHIFKSEEHRNNFFNSFDQSLFIQFQRQGDTKLHTDKQRQFATALNKLI